MSEQSCQVQDCMAPSTLFFLDSKPTPAGGVRATKPHQIQRPLDDLKHIVPPLHPCVELELGQENEQRKKEEGKGEGGGRRPVESIS